ncbi:FT-interacting protein 3-like [Vigna angularis]|uniref:FT-interacting protein 3-like n=1 Tax=Phaseolus angularis TaxID=3914 RepID=UPI0022B3C306|nr:FT-interacting protein 3-like [Vigna angularis]
MCRGGEKKKETKFSSRIHLRVCLEGGYHVFDESTHYSNDLRPTAKQLWKAHIGILELGIISAQGLMPMKTRDGRGTTNAYCVAKYGQKWIRTRKIVDSLALRWNEQYIWEVFDPCTVITVGVHDNVHLHVGEKLGASKDSRIGKVRIRLSTLEADRVYTHSYPLLVLHNSGVKKMGEVQLAIRFTSLSVIDMLSMYTQHLLPKMHYIHPLSVIQLDGLRHQVIQIVSMRLSRAEPPLRKEVVEYMLDVNLGATCLATLGEIKGDWRQFSVRPIAFFSKVLAESSLAKTIYEMLEINIIQEEGKIVEDDLPPPKPPNLNWRAHATWEEEPCIK